MKKSRHTILVWETDIALRYCTYILVMSFHSCAAGIRLKYHNDMLPESFSSDPRPCENLHKGTRNPTQEYDFLPRGHES